MISGHQVFSSDTCLNSSSLDAILVVFANLFTKKANKPSLVQWPEILLCASSSLRVSQEYNTPG